MYNTFYQDHLQNLSLQKNEIHALCPFHDDQKPSFYANIQTGQFYCHACGEKGNAITFAQKLNIPLQHVPGYDPNIKSKKVSAKPELLKAYDYVDEEGKLLYQVCRFTPKDFRQRRPNGKGGWIYDLKNVKRVLYRLPKIMKADQVIIVEGEKDVDNLFAADFIATTNSGGAGIWSNEYNQYFKDKQVILIPDNDPPGMKHMQVIEESLQGIARSIKIVPLPMSLGPKGDVSDFLRKYSSERLLHLIASPLPELELNALELSQQEINNFKPSDTGNARLLCKCYGDKIRYQHDKDNWLIWNGHLWQPDRLGKVNLLPVLVAQKRFEAIQVVQDKKRIEKIRLFVDRCESAGKIASCLNLAQSMSPIASQSSEYNLDPYLLGCANGVLDLRTGSLLNSNKRELVSMSTNVIFDPQAECPRWEQFLEEIFDTDKEMINFINLAVGYSLTGEISEQCLFILYGKGANGKSTFLNVLLYVMGDYADITPFTTFLASAYDGCKISNDIAALNNKRLVFTSEAGESSLFNEQRLKSLTGSDKVKARFLRKEYFTFNPTFKFWLAVNHKPNITDNTEGFWRRIRLVPFEQNFSVKNCDTQLESKLLKEASGILNWIVKGCLAWQKNGLIVPDKVKTLTQEYRRESNVIELFLEEMTVQNPESRIQASALFTVWKSWTAEHNENPMSMTRFGSKMSSLGYEKQKNGNNYYLGIELKEENHG